MKSEIVPRTEIIKLVSQMNVYLSIDWLIVWVHAFIVEFLVIYLLGIFTRCYELNMAEMNTNFGIHFFVVEFFKIWGVGGMGRADLSVYWNRFLIKVWHTNWWIFTWQDGWISNPWCCDADVLPMSYPSSFPNFFCIIHRRRKRWSTRRGIWGRGWRPPPPHTETYKVSTCFKYLMKYFIKCSFGSFNTSWTFNCCKFVLSI